MRTSPKRVLTTGAGEHVMPVPGNLMPSSGYICRQNTHTHINKQTNKSVGPLLDIYAGIIPIYKQTNKQTNQLAEEGSSSSNVSSAIPMDWGPRLNGREKMN